MSDGLLTVLTLISALGCGLVGGIFFAFSAFIMNALSRLPPAANRGAHAAGPVHVSVSANGSAVIPARDAQSGSK